MRVTEKKAKRKEEALAAFAELIDIIDTLRSPDGCPWDRKQTSLSLKPYIVEETYEVLDAIDSGNSEHVKEELGDVLLQIMLHSQIAFEEDAYHVGDVIRRLSKKMIERHPHVFSDVEVNDSAEVVANWEKIKAGEKKARGLLEGIPSSLPGLLMAFRMGQKAARVGFDWPDGSSVRLKVLEELQELDEAIANGDDADKEHELGDLLFAVCQWGRHLGVEPEEAVRRCCQRFQSRLGHVEAELNNRNKAFDSSSLEELETLWQQAKVYERKH